MASTYSAIRQSLPSVLADITLSYFRTNSYDPMIMARQGRYEECESILKESLDIFGKPMKCKKFGGERAIMVGAIAGGHTQIVQLVTTLFPANAIGK